jgi:hypothetical protein
MPTALRWRGYRFFFWSGDRDEPPHTRVKRVLDFGESLKRSVRSRIRTIIEDLLKLQNSPPQEPRGGWYDTVLAQRSDLLDEADGEHPARSRARVAGPVRRGTTECCHVFAQARRECGRRRPARHLPLHVRPDHRRRAAVARTLPTVARWRGLSQASPPGRVDFLHHLRDQVGYQIVVRSVSIDSGVRWIEWWDRLVVSSERSSVRRIRLHVVDHGLKMKDGQTPMRCKLPALVGQVLADDGQLTRSR